MPLRLEPWNGEGVHLPQAEVGRQALDLLEGIDTLHCREHAARREQMPCQRDELGNFGKRAGNDAIEFLTGAPCLDPLAYHSRVPQLKVGYRLPEESRFLVIAVEQCDLDVRPRHCKGNPGKSRAAANIQHSGPTQVWGHGEAVKQVAADHFPSVSYGGEVIDLVPFLQEREILKKLAPVVATQWKTQFRRSFFEAPAQLGLRWPRRQRRHAADLTGA